MNEGVSVAPLSGTLRVVYFLALAGVAIALFAVSMTEVYKEPEADLTTRRTNLVRTSVDSAAKNRYERNMGVILTLAGTAVAVIGIVALPARFNAMRTGLLAGGAAVFFTGVGYASGGANSWLTLIWAIVAFVALLASSSWLEAGSEAYARLPLPSRSKPTA